MQDRMVLAWARLNVPGSIAHATMVMSAINSSGMFTVFLAHNPNLKPNPNRQADGIPLVESPTGGRSRSWPQSGSFGYTHLTRYVCKKCGT